MLHISVYGGINTSLLVVISIRRLQEVREVIIINSKKHENVILRSSPVVRPRAVICTITVKRIHAR